MLMALLPLAGWAADLKKVEILSPYYGQAPTTINVFGESSIPLVKDADYTFDGYFSDAEANNAVTEADIKAANAGTVFYAKVSGINGYENYLVSSFEVKKMPLTITVADASKTYGDPDPASFTVTAVQIAGGVAAPAAVASSVTAGREGGENVKAGNYSYTATVANQANYEIGTVNGTFTITPKAFTDGGTVDVTVVAELTYNGAAQEATITVRDKAKNAVLVKGTDYTIVFSNNTNAHASNPTATITGKGNYNASNIVKNFAIAAAPLLVTPTAKKVYANNASVPAIPANVAAFTDNVYFTFQGFVDTKTAADVTWTGTTTWSSSDAAVNKGTYKLAINAANDLTLANYRFIPIEGTFEITQSPITFTADNKTIDFGDAENYALTDAWKATAIDADEENLAYAIKITRAATAETSGANAGKFKLTPAYLTDAEIDAKVDADGGIAAAAKAAKKLAVKTARNNYKGTFAVGYATVNKAPLQIALKESAYKLEKVYDGQPVSVTLDKANGLTIIGKKSESDVINLDNLTLSVVSNAANKGTYQLKLDGATADNYTITYIPSQYKITERPLRVTIYDQTFEKDAVPSLNTALYDIQEGVANEGLIEGDRVFKLEIDWTVLTKDGDGKITSAAATYDDAIKAVDEGSVASKWANYNVIQTKGKALIVATPIVLDDTKAYTAWAATPTGTPTPNSSIMFTKRVLNAEQWNVLVLPFEIAVKDLAAAFDYAVIDVLDTDQNDGNVHFKLKVAGTIAANTPFLIYPSGVKKDLNQVVFVSVPYRKPAQATYAVADGSGNKFVGTYQTTGIYGSDKQYVSGGKFYAATNYTADAPAPIKPLRGYLDLSGNTNASRAMIYIDEPDGTTTAIKAVNAEQMLNVVNGEGWYNMNGVKLQGAPTQKGIYIKNGKKIVVK